MIQLRYATWTIWWKQNLVGWIWTFSGTRGRMVIHIDPLFEQTHDSSAHGNINIYIIIYIHVYEHTNMQKKRFRTWKITAFKWVLCEKFPVSYGEVVDETWSVCHFNVLKHPGVPSRKPNSAQQVTHSSHHCHGVGIHVSKPQHLSQFWVTFQCKLQKTMLKHQECLGCTHVTVTWRVVTPEKPAPWHWLFPRGKHGV